MESTATPSPTTPVPPSADRPVFAHTPLQPLPKYSVLVAVGAAAALPVILLVLTVAVMVALNYNILNWME